MLVNQQCQAAAFVGNLLNNLRHNSIAGTRSAHNGANRSNASCDIAESLRFVTATTQYLSAEERQKVSVIIGEIETKLRAVNKYRNADVLSALSGLRSSVNCSIPVVATPTYNPSSGLFRFAGKLLGGCDQPVFNNVQFTQIRSFRTRRGLTFHGLQNNRPSNETAADSHSGNDSSASRSDADKRKPNAGESAGHRSEEQPRTPYLRFIHAAGQTSRLVTNIALAWLALYFCFLVLEWTGRLGPKDTSNNANGGFSKSIGPLTFSANNVKEFSPEIVSVTLDDVRGCDEVKKELVDVVNFLKEPQRFTKMGAKLPRGILLVGPPGTGKTLIARAIAGEANVPFFFAAGSEFDEVFVGTGAKRIRQLFEAAKQRAPCIIFIDEIDAVGGKRTSSPIHPYANQTINQLLSEMDGFEQNDGIIVLAATNRKDHLDSALLRPGRFDETVHIHAPDVRGRRDIFDLYVGKIKFDKRDVDVDALARATIGMTGADIRNMVNQAALLAALGERDAVRMENFWAAYDKMRLGPARERIRDEATNFNTAIHEAGHALVACLTATANEVVHKVTIVSRGATLGHTAMIPEKDEYGKSLEQLLGEIDVCLGGRIAEELAFGVERATTGASNDLQRATSIAEAIVKNLGFSKKLGVRTIESDRTFGDFYTPGNADSLSPATRQVIDEEVSRILGESYQRVRKLLTDRQTELRAVADALVKHETLSGDDVQAIIKSPSNYKLTERTLSAKKQSAQHPTSKAESAKDKDKDDASKAKPAAIKAQTKPITLKDE